MVPTLADGDWVFVAPRKRVSVGAIVVLRHPFKPVWLIKRVSMISEEGRLTVVGDNPAESTDSRTLGTFSPSQVMGYVTSRITRTKS